MWGAVPTFESAAAAEEPAVSLGGAKIFAVAAVEMVAVATVGLTAAVEPAAASVPTAAVEPAAEFVPTAAVEPAAADECGAAASAGATSKVSHVAPPRSRPVGARIAANSPCARHKDTLSPAMSTMVIGSTTIWKAGSSDSAVQRSTTRLSAS